MKLENSVCTPDQAKRLAELGIYQETFHTWCFKGIWTLTRYVQENFLPHTDYDVCLAAYTVAELSVMLPPGISCKLRENGWRVDYPPAGYGASGGPQDLVWLMAGCLIELLESGRIAADEVNEWLKQSKK